MNDTIDQTPSATPVTETFVRLSTTDVAKRLRAVLKDTFPGIKFSVRCDKYSGGSSIDVSWNDGPAEDEVDKVVCRYEGAGFDGMQDLKYYKDDVTFVLPDGSIEHVDMGVDYIHTHRYLSEQYTAQLALVAAQELRIAPEDFKLDGWYTGLGYGQRAWRDGSGHEFVWFLSKLIAPAVTPPAAKTRKNSK
jgi:hypothetical protein